MVLNSMSKWLICLIIVISICTASFVQSEDSPFNRLRDTFGEWKVRHVYDTETFQYRCSDAQARIMMDEDNWVRFDINRDTEGNFYLSTFGWLDQVIIEIDGETFTQEPLEKVNFHRFTQDVDDVFLKAIANTKEDIRVGLGFKGKVRWGTLSPKGSSAALRWIGTIK